MKAEQFRDFYIPKPYIDYLPVGEKVKEYILIKPYVVKWVVGDTTFRITVPKHLNTDFGTTPGKIFNDPIHIAGYIAHDWIYFEHTNPVPPDEFGQVLPWYEYLHPRIGEWRPAIGDWSRKNADELMNGLHKVAGVPTWQRTVIYRAVRIFGQSYWES